ncbi:MAG TPA: UDP-N-acetylmuramoyl-tripeptide--D-alanyl-D-alanine ligase [Myxococcales bacterium]|jgi:UDP-N-acetylmuramoyl-tripeptide--D-alanyl-D-alanine ligase
MTASFTRDELLQATAGASTAVGVLPEQVDGVSTDTRTIAKGSLFVALKGETFDANDFLDKAAAAGAGMAVVRRGAKIPAGLPCLEVEDTLAALGRIARHHRRRFNLPLGAITGSNGKTTTKEMIGAILATRGPALKTEGNLNNEVGVPLTLLQLDRSHTGAIIEMGMNHPGELSRLTAFTEPLVAEITIAAPAHLEFLGSVENVAKAKGEIYGGLGKDGLAIANGDDALVRAQAKACGRKVLLYGKCDDADVRLSEIVSHDADGLAVRIAWAGKKHLARLKFVGEHNAVNACGAFAMGVSLGCSAEQCVAGLEASRPWAHRLSLHDVPGGFTVIDDCYNANPSSMGAALDTLKSLAGPRRSVAVLGDMLELGAGEAALHRQMGERAVANGVQVLVSFGPRSKAGWEAARGALGERALHVPATDKVEPAVEFLKAQLKAGDVVLVKGSRGMKLERIVEALTGVKGGAH